MGVSACVLITSAALTVVLLTQLGPICERDRVCVQPANKKQNQRSHITQGEEAAGRPLQQKSVRQTQQTNFQLSSWFSRPASLSEKCRGGRWACCVVYLAHYRCMRFQLLFAERLFPCACSIFIISPSRWRRWMLCVLPASLGDLHSEILCV
jgi:hypothetical protein